MTQKNLQISYQSIVVFGLGMAAVMLALWVANTAGASFPAKNLLSGSPPQVVSYQGKVEVNGSAYDGTGFFKFAIVDVETGDGSINHWANDGKASGEPSQTVPLTVSGGLFDIMLGDTTVSGMTTPMADTVFGNSDTYLRAWFSKQLNGPFDALEPNRRIGSVPYALRASYAETGSAMVPAGAVMFFDSASCPSGWSEFTAARGRTVVGLPSGGTSLGSVGTALSDRENRGHNHTVNPSAVSSTSAGSHKHDTGEPDKKGAVNLDGSGIIIDFGRSDHIHTTTSNGSHTHSVNVASTNSSNASTSSVIPYIQMLACRKDAS